MLKRRDFFKIGAISLASLSLKLEAKPNRIKFIHITDSHLDLSDEDTVDAVKLAVKFINKNYKDLDFVLFGGDNFNNNVAGDKDALVFKQILDDLHCDYFVVRGNKESHPNPNDGIFLKEFKRLFVDNKGLIVSGKDWAFEKNGYIILGLDSCIEGKDNGVFSKETIAFAKKMLLKNKPTIILNHHPYTNYWGGKDEKDIHKYVLNNSKEVIDELFKFKNLILTLSGHKHIDSVKTLNGTKVITTRGFIRALDLDMYPMRYVEIEDNKINEKLIYTS